MFLILAIEPDRRQANRLSAIARGPLRNAELVIVDTVDAALDVLARHAPDLVLTSMLLSAKDDAMLAGRLRELDTTGRQVQTLVIPMFAAPSRKMLSEGGLLARLTRSEDDGSSQGCQPAVFAAQINEYLDDLQLEDEAREMRQPYSAPAQRLHQQPTVSEPHEEIIAAVPAEAVILPEPAANVDSGSWTEGADANKESGSWTEDAEMESSYSRTGRTTADVGSGFSRTEPPAANVASSDRIERPSPDVASGFSRTERTPVAAPRLTRSADPVPPKEPVHQRVAPPPIEAPRVIDPPRVIVAPRVVEPTRMIEQPSAVDPTESAEARTAEPTRLIAPSPAIEPRRASVHPAGTESIVSPAVDQNTDPVAEPTRLIAPSPVVVPPAVEPHAESRATEPDAHPTAARPAPAPSRPNTGAKAKPKVTKVRIGHSPFDTDPEVARFMAALRELPSVDLVEPDAGAEPATADHNDANGNRSPDSASIGSRVKVASAESIDANAARHDAFANTPSRDNVAKSGSPEPPAAPPKSVKALKPARLRGISPAAAPPPVPTSRKRVTPIRRGAPAATQSDAAPEAVPDIDEPPAAAPTTPVKVVGRIQPASSVPSAPAAARAAKQKGASRRSRPIQDEWGFFDPDQCGFPAVQAKLEQIEEPDIFRTVKTPPKPRS